MNNFAILIFVVKLLGISCFDRVMTMAVKRDTLAARHLPLHVTHSTQDITNSKQKCHQKRTGFHQQHMACHQQHMACHQQHTCGTLPTVHSTSPIAHNTLSIPHGTYMAHWSFQQTPNTCKPIPILLACEFNLLQSCTKSKVGLTRGYTLSFRIVPVWMLWPTAQH